VDCAIVDGGFGFQRYRRVEDAASNAYVRSRADRPEIRIDFATKHDARVEGLKRPLRVLNGKRAAERKD
jgi:hypothetical protein